jgi:hypothetical protein
MKPDLRVWFLSLRSLSSDKMERKPFTVTVACYGYGEKEALAFAKKNVHTPEWWEQYLVTDISCGERLWAVES